MRNGGQLKFRPMFSGGSTGFILSLVGMDAPHARRLTSYFADVSISFLRVSSLSRSRLSAIVPATRMHWKRLTHPGKTRFSM